MLLSIICLINIFSTLPFNTYHTSFNIQN